MKTNIQLIINRKPEVIKRLGISKATFHTRINQNLLPPPISLGQRAVGYLQHEIDAVIAAMVAGKSNAEVKLLVSDLVAQRKLAA
ncbi:AlpA family phage regulatory protein [Paraglaciecola sp. 25GB23A]|uniref:helix-turn-helix transcriptional regulator n=1 Tax=Paraglaciecola sp. 25GB23A TaxID=3156068 RepID=UPI0032B01526